MVTTITSVQYINITAEKNHCHKPKNYPLQTKLLSQNKFGVLICDLGMLSTPLHPMDNNIDDKYLIVILINQLCHIT